LAICSTAHVETWIDFAIRAQSDDSAIRLVVEGGEITTRNDLVVALQGQRPNHSRRSEARIESVIARAIRVKTPDAIQSFATRRIKAACYEDFAIGLKENSSHVAVRSGGRTERFVERSVRVQTSDSATS